MKKFLVLIGIALFAIILLSIDFEKTIGIILKADISFIFLAILFSILTIFVRCFKWLLILRHENVQIGPWKVFKYYYIGIVFGTFTPGRLGEFAKALYLKEPGISKVLATVLIDRLTDIAVLFFMGLIASAIFSFYFGVAVFSFAMLAILLMAFIFSFYIFMQKPLLKRIMRPFYNYLVPEKFKRSLRQGFDSFMETSYSVLREKKLISISGAISLASWAMMAFVFYLLALSLNLSVPLDFTFLVVPISTLVMLVPISISGIGTRDAATIWLLSFVGIAKESALALSLLYFFVSVIVAAFGLLLFIRSCEALF